MVWVRLDEQFARSPKVVKAGPLGMAMQVAALCYCNDLLTDGFVPRSVAATLLDLDGLAMNVWASPEGFGGGEDAAWEDIVGALVDAEMWCQIEGGWQIHDYLEYQPSREKVLSDRSAAAERRQTARDQAKAKAQAKAGAKVSKPRSPKRNPNVGETSAEPNPNVIPPEPDPASSKNHPHPTVNHESERDPAADEDDSQGEKIHEAAKRIAQRRLQRTPTTVGNAGAWLAKTGGAAELDVLRLLRTDPTLDVDALVAALDPDPLPPTQAPVAKPPTPAEATASAEHARRTATPCTDCGSRNGMRLNDAGHAEPCPTCNAGAVGRVDFKVAT